MRPDSYGYHSISTTYNLVQFISNVVQITGKNSGKTNGGSMTLELEQNVMFGVHRHERSNIFRTAEVHFHKIWNKKNANNDVVNVSLSVKKDYSLTFIDLPK